MALIASFSCFYLSSARLQAAKLSFSWVGIEPGASCMPGEHSTDRATLTEYEMIVSEVMLGSLGEAVC